MLSAQTLLFALLGGFLPALFWLWFWLRQDKKRPEPRGLIMLAFVAGMLAVPFALPFQEWARDSYGVGTITIFFWATTEEILKWGFAYWAVLRRKELDESIDAMIYMITVALGFAALENTLFILDPLLDGSIVTTVQTGNLRFLGATLLHILSSATIGAAIALSLFKKQLWRWLYTVFGLILAIVLHALFNFFIIESNGEKVLLVFLAVWIGVILLMLIFERIKRIRLNKI